MLYPLIPRGPDDHYGLYDDNGLVKTVTSYVQDQIRQSDLSPMTVDRYRQGVESFARYLDSLEFVDLPGQSTDEKILLAGRNHVRSWLTSRRVVDVDVATRGVDEVAVRALYRYLETKESGWALAEHPYSVKEKLSTPKKYRRRNLGMSVDQIITLLGHLHNEAERAFFHFAYDVGGRISALCALTKGAIDEAIAYVDRRAASVRYVPMVIGIQKKGGAEMQAHPALVSAPTLQRVAAYYHSAAYEDAIDWDYDDPMKPAFLTVTGQAWAPPNARRHLQRAVSRGGIVLAGGRNVTPHTFRYSSAYSVLSSEDHGKDRVDNLIAAMAHLGHAHPNTTAYYSQLPINDLMRLSEDRSVYDRAARLVKETQLPERKHTEKRGHYPRKRRSHGTRR